MLPAMNIKAMNFKSMPSSELLMTWLPRLTSVALVIAIAFAVAQIVWLFTVAPQTPQVDIDNNIVATQAAPASDQPAIYAGQISNLHLFGVADIQATEIVAPETKLNLELRGIFAVGEKDGLAMIASGNDEEVYAVGDKIPGNATLKAVYADRVLLESSRGLETLRLPKEKELIVFESAIIEEPAPAVPYAGTEDYISSEQFATDQDAPRSIADYRRQFIRNPASLAEIAQIEPGEVDGELKGYKLRFLKDDPVLGSLNLQPDDIITSVNGVALDKPENGVKALRMLMKAKDINVTVLRDGQEIDMQLSLE
ncbi:MAG TPA: type II secretion system protein GspC [Gammaproteobacteria bacterium]